MKLTQKQIKVINDLFEMNGDETAVLEKNKLSPILWRRWLCSKEFIEGIECKLESYKMAGQILLARYNAVAAARLVQLCESKSSETSRKACMVILANKPGIKQNEEGEDEPVSSLEPETASKILAILAERKRNKSL
ncbi:MAG: hypothetical protein A2Y10_02705 [Planctomycetes bacterium GWF2_41_51]|nr:MAG: hypothetical protein A2Y10_02705 [Planctomycetes bacterium GWF2_41_51]HBG27460.1 hypothetical protein [Phycisphaerales bacterium]